MITYVLHADGWAVGWWDKSGKWKGQSKHKRRSDAVAEVLKVKAKERIDAISDASPSNDVQPGSLMDDPPL